MIAAVAAALEWTKQATVRGGPLLGYSEPPPVVHAARWPEPAGMVGNRFYIQDCRCGWRGPPCTTEEDATTELEQHLTEAAEEETAA